MSRQNDPITQFLFGETIIFDIDCKDRPSGGEEREPLSNPTAQIIRFTLSPTVDGLPFVSFTDPPFVTLIDSAASTWRITVPASEYMPGLVEGRKYFYEVSSTLGTSDPMVQAQGVFMAGGSQL